MVIFWRYWRMLLGSSGSARFAGFAMALVLTSCTSLPQSEAPQTREATEAAILIAHNPWSAASGSPMAAASDWVHFPLPGKSATSYSYVHHDGRDSMAAQAGSSSSMLRRELRLSPAELGDVTFSWQVPALIKNGDITVPEFDDSPVRILLVFEGDRTKFSEKNALLSELTHFMVGEPLPYATLMYVWSNQQPEGRVIISPHTDRIRSIVVESGSKHLNQWLDYERHISADFEKAYGEAPGALLRVGIMTDSDNTRSQTTAWYGALRFRSTFMP